jgi:hypothetical protein
MSARFHSPQLHIFGSLHQLCLVLHAPNEENARARAAGYAHTWCHQQGIELAALSRFPSASNVALLTCVGYEEAISLWEALGIIVEDLDKVPPLDNVDLALTNEDVCLLAFSAAFPELQLGNGDHNVNGTETGHLQEFVQAQESMPSLDTEGRLLSAVALALLANEFTHL